MGEEKFPSPEHDEQTPSEQPLREGAEGVTEPSRSLESLERDFYGPARDLIGAAYREVLADKEWDKEEFNALVARDARALVAGLRLPESGYSSLEEGVAQFKKDFAEEQKERGKRKELPDWDSIAKTDGQREESFDEEEEEEGPEKQPQQTEELQTAEAEISPIGFSEGEKVFVEDNGKLEDGWEVLAIEGDEVLVKKNAPDERGIITKTVPIRILEEMQEEGLHTQTETVEAQHPEPEAEPVLQPEEKTEVQKETEISEPVPEPVSAQAEIPSEARAEENEKIDYEQLKYEHDPIVKFLKKIGVSDEDIKHADIKYLTVAKVPEDRPDDPHIAVPKNYHDLQGFRGSFSPEERAHLDSIAVPVSQGEEWSKVDVWMDKEFDKRFRKGGDLEQFATARDELQEKIKNGEIPDEYAALLESAQKQAAETPKEEQEKKEDLSKPKPGTPEQEILEPEPVYRAEQPEPEKEPVTLDIKAEKVEDITPKEAGSERKEDQPVSFDVVHRFERDFGVSGDDLERIEGFSKLTEGQQKMVLENLRQVTLGRIHDEAGKDMREEFKNANAFGRFWKNFGKHYRIAKLEKNTYNGIMHGGTAAHGEILKQLVKGVEHLGLDVHEDEGKLLVDYVGEKNLAASDHGLLSVKERDDLSEFNAVARELSLMPKEWQSDAQGKIERGVQKLAGRGKYGRYEAAEQRYTKLKERIMDVYLRNHGHDKTAAALYFNDIDEKVRLNQFFNTNPDAEKELNSIRDESVWRKTLGNIVTERGLTLSAGTLARSISWGLAGALGGTIAVPMGAALSGAYLGRRRAHTELRERQHRLREGEVLSGALSRENFAKKNNELLMLQVEKKKLEERRKSLPWNGRESVDDEIAQKESRIEALKKETRNMRSLDTDFISGDRLARRIEQLTEALASGKKPLTEEELQQNRIPQDLTPNEKLEYANRLRVRLEYTQKKISEGQVRFGKTGDSGSAEETAVRLSQQLALLQAVGKGETMMLMQADNDPRIQRHFFRMKINIPTGNNTSVEKSIDLTEDKVKQRLERFRKYRSQEHSKTQAAYIRGKMRWAALISGGSALAGYLIREAANGELEAWWDKFWNTKTLPNEVTTPEPETFAMPHAKTLTPPAHGHTSSVPSHETPHHISSPGPENPPPHHVPPPAFGGGEPPAHHVPPPPFNPPHEAIPHEEAAPERLITIPKTSDQIMAVPQIHNPVPGLERMMESAGHVSPEEVLKTADAMDNLAMKLRTDGSYDLVRDLGPISHNLHTVADNFNHMPPEVQKELLERVDALNREIYRNGFFDTVNPASKAHLINPQGHHYLFLIHNSIEKINSMSGHPITPADEMSYPHELPNPEQPMPTPPVSEMHEAVPNPNISHEASSVQHEVPTPHAETSNGNILNSDVPSGRDVSNQHILEEIKRVSAPHANLSGAEKALAHASSLELFSERGFNPENLLRIDHEMKYLATHFDNEPLLVQDEIIKKAEVLKNILGHAKVTEMSGRQYRALTETLRYLDLEHARTERAFDAMLRNYGYTGEALKRITTNSNITLREVVETYQHNKETHTDNPFVKWLVENKKIGEIKDQNAPLSEYLRGTFKINDQKLQGGFLKNFGKSFRNMADVDFGPRGGRPWWTSRR